MVLSTRVLTALGSVLTPFLGWSLVSVFLHILYLKKIFRMKCHMLSYSVYLPFHIMSCFTGNVNCVIFLRVVFLSTLRWSPILVSTDMSWSYTQLSLSGFSRLFHPLVTFQVPHLIQPRNSITPLYIHRLCSVSLPPLYSNAAPFALLTYCSPQSTLVFPFLICCLFSFSFILSLSMFLSHISCCRSYVIHHPM